MITAKQDYIMMALMLLMSVGLIAAVATTVGYATKAASREYEYEMLRQEYQARIEKEKRGIVDVITELNERIESEAYVNKRRYELLSAELYDVCLPAINELELRNKENNVKAPSVTAEKNDKNNKK